MSNKPLIQTLSYYYASLKPCEIPPEVMRRARLSLLDYLAVYACGYHRGVLSEMLLNFVLEKNSRPESSILLLGRKIDAEWAAFASGAIAHSVELDDGHRFGTAHPAVAVIPSALAVAEKIGCTLEYTLASIVVGYDVMLRLARAINPSHLKRGFHTSSTTGTIGSAAACAYLYRHDGEQFGHALSIAGLLSSGLQEMLHDNPAIKAFQVGRSTQSGVLAAEMATRGAKGPSTLLEGRHGWIGAMCDAFRQSDLIGELGERWEITNTYTKLYPTCRHCHHALDLGVTLHAEGLDANEIASIEVRTYSVAISEVGSPALPATLDAAMFSLPYALAVALIEGQVTIDDLSRHLDAREATALARTVSVTAAPEQDDKYPHERGCELRIVLRDGRQIRRATHLPKGEPDTPLTEVDFMTKFESITRPFGLDDRVHTAWKLVMDDDSDLPISTLIDCMDGTQPDMPAHAAEQQ